MSQIQISLDGATQDQTNRIRRILEILFDQNIFNFQNGKIVLHFDAEGTLRVIDWEKTKWRKEKMTLPVIIDAFKSFTVEMKL